MFIIQKGGECNEKRISLITIIVLVILTLVGCQNNEDVENLNVDVENLIEDINNIGVVDINSLSAITNAETDYEELKDNKKELVENYDVLLEARQKYDKIKNFVDIGEKYENSIYIVLSEDRSFISLDTNPSDTKDFYDVSTIAIDTIKEFHKDLGIPDIVYEKMLNTRLLDGIQEHTTGDIKVSWSYHPERGLEALYELIK